MLKVKLRSLLRIVKLKMYDMIWNTQKLKNSWKYNLVLNIDVQYKLVYNNLKK